MAGNPANAINVNTTGIVYFNTSTFQSIGNGFAGQVLTSAGMSSQPIWASSPAAKFVLISSQTAANVSTISFTSIQGYTSYFLNFRGVRPTTNTDILQMLVSTDNGTAYQVSGYTSGLSYTPYNSATLNNINQSTYFAMSSGLSSTGFMDGFVYIYSLNVGLPACINGLATWNDTTLATQVSGQISGNAANSVNAIRLQMGAGNIANGVFSLYALSEA